MTLLQDMGSLKFMGMDTDFGVVQSGVGTDNQRKLLEDNDLIAKQAWDLVCALTKFRLSSMSWHCNYWPGALALAGSGNLADRRACLHKLQHDLAVFEEASKVAARSTFVDKFVQESPFATTAMQEISELVKAGLPEEEVLATLSSFSQRVFSGFGQTKVIEDGLQRLRSSEQRTVANKKVECARQWSTLRGQKVLGLHQRDEVEPPPEATAERRGLSKAASTVRGRAPTLDASAFTHKATWPTLSAQSLQGLSVEHALLEHCFVQGQFEEASCFWKALSVHIGAVIFKEGRGHALPWPCGLHRPLGMGLGDLPLEGWRRGLLLGHLCSPRGCLLHGGPWLGGLGVCTYQGCLAGSCACGQQLQAPHLASWC